MYSFALLESGCYYLIQEKENTPLSLIRINMNSDHCVFISQYGDEEKLIWKRKSDPILDIVELLDDKAVEAWEATYNKDAFNYEEEEEDE
jgi:hypothetical protein